MKTPESILEDALNVPAKTGLGPHLQAIRALQDKKYSWREIAAFLNERGTETDHTRLIRFIKQHDDPFAVPTADEYYAALSKLKSKGKLGEDTGKWAMLDFHFNAHNRTATYTQIAEAAGRAGAPIPASKPWTYANQHYGNLGKEIGVAIGMNFLPSTNREKPFYSSAIGLGNPATPPGAQFELVMHHELAKALIRLTAD